MHTDPIYDDGSSSDLAFPEDEPAVEVEVSRETKMFVRGFVIGFGVATALSALFGFMRARRPRYEMGGYNPDMPDEPAPRQGFLEGLADLIEHGISSFVQALESIERTAEAGVTAVGTVQEALRALSKTSREDAGAEETAS